MCMSDAEDAISAAHSRDAASLTPEIVEGLASALTAAVEAAFAKGVPDKAKWSDAVKEVASSGSTSAVWMPATAELCELR